MMNIVHFCNFQQAWWSPVLCCNTDTCQDDLPNLLYIVGRVINYLISDQQDNFYKGSQMRLNEVR